MTDPFSRGAHLRDQPAGDAQFNTDACPYAMWDAAYVLGSLSSTERREYEGHLPLCRHCCAAVTEFGGVPALLGMLRPDEVAKIQHAGQAMAALGRMVDTAVTARRENSRNEAQRRRLAAESARFDGPGRSPFGGNNHAV